MELPIDIRSYSNRSALYYYICTNNRLPIFIGYNTVYIPSLILLHLPGFCHRSFFPFLH